MCFFSRIETHHNQKPGLQIPICQSWTSNGGLKPQTTGFLSVLSDLQAFANGESSHLGQLWLRSIMDLRGSLHFAMIKQDTS